MEQAPEFRERGERNGEGKKGHEEKKRGGISQINTNSPQNISSSKLKTVAQRCLAFTRLPCNPQNPVKETLLLSCAVHGDAEAHRDWLKAAQLGTDSLRHEPRRSGCSPLTQMPGQPHWPTTHRISPGTRGQALRASSEPHQWAAGWAEWGAQLARESRQGCIWPVPTAGHHPEAVWSPLAAPGPFCCFLPSLNSPWCSPIDKGGPSSSLPFPACSSAAERLPGASH